MLKNPKSLIKKVLRTVVGHASLVGYSHDRAKDAFRTLYEFIAVLPISRQLSRRLKTVDQEGWNNGGRLIV
ncbi:MAG: hypothetical protein ACO2OY_01340 [Thermodesulfobacteriaceae bacterium]